MISIKSIATSILIFSSLSLQAQIEKGTKSINLSFNRSTSSYAHSQSLGVNSNSSYASTSFNPTINFFIKENIALKVGLNTTTYQKYWTNTTITDYPTNGKTNNLQVGGNIGLEKWIPIKALNNKFYFITGINAGYKTTVLGSNKNNTTTNNYNIKGYEYDANLYLKLATFITPRWNASVSSSIISYSNSKEIFYNSSINAPDVQNTDKGLNVGLGKFSSSIGISYFFSGK